MSDDIKEKEESKITIEWTETKEEILRFDPDGKVFHHGRLIGEDEELFPIVQKVLKGELQESFVEEIQRLEVANKSAYAHIKDLSNQWRYKFAASAMQGLLAGMYSNESALLTLGKYEKPTQEICKIAIQHADALLAELKQKPEGE